MGEYVISNVTHMQDMYYEIEIIHNLDHSPLQTIEVRNGSDLTQLARITIIDTGKDGMPELWVHGGNTEKGTWYKIWKYDAYTRQFLWSHTTEPGSIGPD